MPIELNIYKAQGIGDQETLDCVITLNEPIPDPPKEAADYPLLRDWFVREAETLENALHNALPGGTYDALFGLMAKRKASVFVVSHKS